MNIRNIFSMAGRILLQASIVWLVMLAVNYFIIQKFFPVSQEIKEPISLARDIDFVDDTSIPPLERTKIETEHATWIFTNHGACLEQMVYKRTDSREPLSLDILANAEGDRARGAFLVALDQKTPYYYRLATRGETDDVVTLTYEAGSSHATIQKAFTVHKNTYQVDLAVTIKPYEDAVQARIVYPAPHIQELGKDDYEQGIVGNQKGAIQKITQSYMTPEASWQTPIFGMEDKFFALTLFKDTDHFAQQAYYHMIDTHAVAMVQSASIIKPTTWHLSFYVGPKDEHALQAVDARLEGVLEYSGILSPISKLLWKILVWIYDYVHNYGFAIILLTLLINLLFFPLNVQSMRGAKRSAEMQKKLNYLKQRYKDDPEVLAREQSELIAKNGSALIGGCLPKLVQLPLVIALNRVLTASIHLYKAPFILWITDLSSYDPYYVLPIVIAISIILQTPATDPQSRFTGYAMALVFGAFASYFSVGLCLYIAIGLLLNYAQMALGRYFQWA